MKKVNLYSPVALENWHKDTPFESGIGGSETCHIELAEGLIKAGHDVHSYAPIPSEKKDMYWFHLSELPEENLTDNWIIFRDPSFFDKSFKDGIHTIFVAQDCDYAWTPERLAKVDKYICLCKTHVQFTLQKYPELKGRVYLSTNGIRSDYIRKLPPVKRNPNKIIYTSSPDRGLLLILQNWFRIRERCPEAEIHIFYGFNNVMSILEKCGGGGHLAQLKQELESLMNQPGVVFRGRVGQHTLYEEYLSSNIWYYPTDWPETSCINCMDAQALGCVPVTNKFWALEQNIFHGYIYEGIPQKDPFVKVLQIHKVCDLIENPWTEEQRREMIEDALASFDWRKVCKQYEGWLS